MANSPEIFDVELGFVEKTSAWKLRSKFFPKKVGGKPSWLSLQSLPSPEDLHCQNCKKPLVFLLQIYAPVDGCEEAFHRMIFLFMCIDGKCCGRSANSNFAVFRSQLPKENIYYSSEPPVFVEEGSESPSAEQFDPLCTVCGCPAPVKCEQCHKVNYCGQHHQTMDWEAGHKTACNNNISVKTKKKKKSKLLPEYELVNETEYLPEKQEEKSDVEKMKEYEAFLKSSSSTVTSMQNAQIDDEVEAMIKKPDKAFHKFKKRIALEPEQVLRYQRGGIPLFVSSEHVPSKGDIPSCVCGAERIFEFQILPQLLNYLSLDAVQESVDWGTLIIYTCSKSCSIGNGYVKEFIWKQDFSDDVEKIK